VGLGDDAQAFDDDRAAVHEAEGRRAGDPVAVAHALNEASGAEPEAEIALTGSRASPRAPEHEVT
jgi:hypothetical protein